MNPELIDTHCHLNLPDCFPDPELEIELAAREGVTRLILVGVDLETSQRALAMADAHAGVYAVVGWHPNYTAKYDKSELPRLEEMLKHPKAVALGEIGLDYHWDFATPEQQEVALLDQLGLARSAGKPVVFHCREAYKELLVLLSGLPPHPYLFHCFAGDEEDAQRVRDMDGYIGVDGPITYKKAEETRDILKWFPRDRVVLETDAPYLTPVPHRGKPNKPAYVTFVNNALAAVWHVESTESAAVTTANAVRFFRL